MTKYKETEVTLKNGKVVRIRKAEISDAKNLLTTIKNYIPQSEYIPKLEEEIKLTIAQEEDWIRSFIEHDNSLLLIAEHENQILGNIDLTGNRRKVMEHTALIGMGIAKEFRNIGLGTALLSECVDWAKQNPILELIWLQVYTDNKLGVSLYKKMGFSENGLIKNFFKHKGNYYDNLTMSMKVN